MPATTPRVTGPRVADGGGRAAGGQRDGISSSSKARVCPSLNIERLAVFDLTDPGASSRVAHPDMHAERGAGFGDC